MDNLRNFDGTNGHGSSVDPEYIAYDDEEGTIEAPPSIGQDERRMQVRAYNFWAGLLGDRQFPNIEDLSPETDNDLGPYSVLLDFTGGVENPAITFLGDTLRTECRLDENITTIEQVPTRSLLSRITDHYLQIIANQAPIGFEAEFVNQHGSTIMYRGILLPFSSDDDTIDFIYGVINWKEVAADEFVQTLQREVENAIRSAPRKAETGPIWADSPTSTKLTSSRSEALDIANNEALELTEPLPAEDAGLSDWLVAARNCADSAVKSDQRSRLALYQAICYAYDFYLMTEQHPEDYQILLEDASLRAQERAPMTPVVKLVFGADYDKTRLTEFAAALNFAKRENIARGDFAAIIEAYDGGLKGIVRAERDSRKSKAESMKKISNSDKLLDRLRRAPKRELAEFGAGEEEFVVLVARRDNDGQLAIVGSVVGDNRLTQQALRKTTI